jgi:hypothetical protein
MLLRSIHFRNFKALRHLDLDLRELTILTGPNNAGKSTALSAIRLLDTALRIARRRSPHLMPTPLGRRLAYRVPTEGLSISIENIHTDLVDSDTTVEFILDGGGQLLMHFPPDGGCIFCVSGGLELPQSPSIFRRVIPLQVVQVPVLGPLEDEESLVQETTLMRGIGTHRAARHFRNYWHRYPENFGDFADRIRQTWPGMEVEPPEMITVLKGRILFMYCRENRQTRELYWCGFGFQIWCQLLTHVSRAGPGDVLVVDEPETYLHPSVQRQLLQILRETGAQVVLATHSATLIASAKAGEVAGVDRTRRTVCRYEETGTPLCEELGLLPERDARDSP